jgi:hypothetical protein
LYGAIVDRRFYLIKPGGGGRVATLGTAFWSDYGFSEAVLYANDKTPMQKSEISKFL